MANQPLLRNGHRTPPNSAKIMQNKSHCAIQGHSRSPIFIPIESPHAISISE